MNREEQIEQVKKIAKRLAFQTLRNNSVVATVEDYGHDFGTEDSTWTWVVKNDFVEDYMAEAQEIVALFTPQEQKAEVSGELREQILGKVDWEKLLLTNEEALVALNKYPVTSNAGKAITFYQNHTPEDYLRIMKAQIAKIQQAGFVQLDSDQPFTQE